MGWVSLEKLLLPAFWNCCGDEDELGVVAGVSEVMARVARLEGSYAGTGGDRGRWCTRHIVHCRCH